VAGVLATRSMPLEAPAVGEGQRAGIGFDAHRFGEGGALHLGGLEFSAEATLAGHSDGDAALHAIIDALLGAAAAGSIGSHFPPDDPHWADADSGELMRRAVSVLKAAGWRPVSVDLAIVAAHPEIEPRREEMATRVADLCGIGASAVGVKGTTSDGLGFAGAEGIAAFAVAVVAHA